MAKREGKDKRERMGVYRRILKIDRRIAVGDYPSTMDIINSLEDDAEGKISASTIKRDITRMIEDLNAPIAYSKKEEGWYYTHKTYRLPAMFTTEGELFAAELTKVMVGNALAGTSAITDAQSVLGGLTETVENPLKQPDISPNEWVHQRIVMLGSNNEPIDSKVWKALIEAVKNNREITFMYRPLSEDDYKKRRVRPYQLLLSNGTWSLWCYDVNKKTTRLFNLSRMREVKSTGLHFNYEEHCSYLKKNTGIFGTFTTDTEYEFKIHLWGNSAQSVKNRTWGKNQSVRPLDDGYDGIELCFTANQYDAIFTWVMGFGSECIPAAPARLVDDWKQEIRRLHEYIQKL